MDHAPEICGVWEHWEGGREEKKVVEEGEKEGRQREQNGGKEGITHKMVSLSPLHTLPKKSREEGTNTGRN